MILFAFSSGTAVASMMITQILSIPRTKQAIPLAPYKPYKLENIQPNNNQCRDDLPLCAKRTRITGLSFVY
jgi:hypothetical protein